MGKRKSRDSDFSDYERDKMLKQVKKLKKKLKYKKKKSRHHRRSDSRSLESSDSRHRRSRSDFRSSSRSRSRNSRSSRSRSKSQKTPPKTILQSASQYKTLPQSTQQSQSTFSVQEVNNSTQPPSTQQIQQTNSENEKKQVEEKELSEEVVNIIGPRLIENRVLATPIHSSFTVRWAEILQVGLPTEERGDLIKKYPPPSNCLFLDPPILNDEAKLSVSENCRARDKRIISKHEKLAACMAGIGKSITTLLSRDSVTDVPILEYLSDVARLIADSIHDDISIRRSVILSNINTSMKETLSVTTVDTHLFGSNLAEKLKTAKILDQTAEELKIKKVDTSSFRAKDSKNFKGPPRSQNKNYPRTSGGQKRSSTQRRPQYNDRSHQRHQRYSPKNSSRRRFSRRQ